MQREVKFRGKRVDNGEWVYGSLLISEPQEKSLEPLHYFICPLDKGYHRVIPETIGQYTGLHDKNGKEVYEGDIIQFNDGIVINKSNTHKSAVKWVDELGGFYIHADCIGYYQVNPSQCKMYHFEVIGNVFEDPELIS